MSRKASAGSASAGASAASAASAASGEGPATPATSVLDRAAVPYTRHTYPHDPAVSGYGLEAAAALGVPPARVFKTLLVDSGTGRSSGLAVGIVPVTGQLDLKAIATALGVKSVVLADPAVAERVTGYVIGGISPLGQKRALPTVLDTSADTFPTIYVSGGRRGFDLEVAPEHLVALTGAVRAGIARR